MSDPNLPPDMARDLDSNERLGDEQRMQGIRTMAKVILDARGQVRNDVAVDRRPMNYAFWTARGLGYVCELMTPVEDPYKFFQLRFTLIRRPTEPNTYAFRSENDVISPSIRAVNDDPRRRHIDRLEELVTSGALPGSYDPTEFRDEEDGELLIDNPWLDDEG
jgi:hypothetical protein